MHLDIRKIIHEKTLIDDLTVNNLLSKARLAPNVPATIGKVINGIYTTEYNKWCTASFITYDSFNQDVIDLIEKIKGKAETNYKLECFNPEVHFLKYKHGTEYKPHIDGQYVENDIAIRAIDRDLTCVVYLNDDYQGGEIEFNLFNLKIQPKKGDVLFYPTSFEYVHSVSKVIGERYAIVIWFKTSPELNVNKPINKYTASYLQKLLNHDF